MIYAQVQYIIFTAIKYKRIFERFGFNLPSYEKPQHSSKTVYEFEKWFFDLSANDWINTSTGECLTGYLAPVELSYLLEQAVNTDTH